ILLHSGSKAPTQSLRGQIATAVAICPRRD
ncbi:hypothetical protein AADP99_11090, partial [Escherichia coli]